MEKHSNKTIGSGGTIDKIEVVKQLRDNARKSQVRAYLSLMLIMMFFTLGAFYAYKAGDISQIEAQKKALDDLNKSINNLQDEKLLLEESNQYRLQTLDSLIQYQEKQRRQSIMLLDSIQVLKKRMDD